MGSKLMARPVEAARLHKTGRFWFLVRRVPGEFTAFEREEVWFGSAIRSPPTHASCITLGLTILRARKENIAAFQWLPLADVGVSNSLRDANVIVLFVINMLRRVPTQTRTPMGRFWLTIFWRGGGHPRSCRSQRVKRCSLRGHDRLAFGADEPTTSRMTHFCHRCRTRCAMQHRLTAAGENWYHGPNNFNEGVE